MVFTQQTLSWGVMSKCFFPEPANGHGDGGWIEIVIQGRSSADIQEGKTGHFVE